MYILKASEASCLGERLFASDCVASVTSSRDSPNLVYKHFSTDSGLIGLSAFTARKPPSVLSIGSSRPMNDR